MSRNNRVSYKNFNTENKIATDQRKLETGTQTRVPLKEVSTNENLLKTQSQNLIANSEHNQNYNRLNVAINTQREYLTPAEFQIPQKRKNEEGQLETFKSVENREPILAIKSNSEDDSDVIITRLENIPRKKKTLMKSKQREEQAYTCDIYNTEYLSDIMKHLITRDQEYIVKRNYLYTYNKDITNKQREILLDWLLLLKFQEELPCSHNTYFMIVRLLDNILAKVKIPLKRLQLILIVLYWILAKCHETRMPSVKKLARTCGNAYTVQEILSTERQMLKFLEFSLNVSTPPDFYNCYFQVAGIPENDSFAYSVQYILDVFSLNERFSCFTSCELAYAAIFLTSKFLKREPPSKDLCLIPYEKIADIIQLMNLQMKRVYSAERTKYEVGIYKRYSTSEYLQISKVIGNKIGVYKI